MTTLPEEAVKAAAQCYLDRTVSINETASSLAHAMLTAALPFLSVQGAVKKLEWRDGYNDSQCTIIQADTVGGFYQVRQVDGLVWLDSIGHQTIYPTVEVAKAAAQADYEARILSALEPSDTIETYYARQIEWSKNTFGPALRTKGIIDHIQKELKEIEAEPHDLSEWIDVVILAMDGFWRHGGSVDDLMTHLLAKQKKNMARTWPDWRTMSEDQAIEHDRSRDADHADAGKVEGDGWQPGCDRLPTLQEAAFAAKVLNACNGYDLSVWTDDLWPCDDASEGLRAIIAHSVLPSAPASEGAE